MIWIMLPAYNEQNDLPSLLDKLEKELKDVDHTLVVINDGSTDKTDDILAAYEGRLNLHVVQHPINRGLGETERDGFEYIAWNAARDDLVVRVEGDDTHEPRYMFDLIDKLNEGYDVVNTSRFQPGGGQHGVSKYHAFVSRSANIFMRVVLGIEGVTDYSCGYRAYRAAVLQDALAIYGNNLIQLRGLGFTSTLEIIVKLNVLGCRFAEVPFVLRYDQKKGRSKMVGSITMLGYFIMALLYWWPITGWRWRFRGLRKLYREDPEAAVAQFRLDKAKKKTISSNMGL